jgi:methionyl-tRNA formyltransferase
MRIVVHGQQAFGKAVLEALLKRKENVVGVYVAPDKEGQKADPMKEAALAAKLPLFQPKSYRQPGPVWDEFKALKPDLQVMAFVTLFVPSGFLNIPTHGSIQYHPSLLPLHRGPSSINWPIIQGRTETGLSIFWPDDGLDTGPILLQKKTPVSDDDSLGSVYFDRLFPMGVEAMLEAVDLVKAGKAPKVAQDHAKATYEGWCTPDNARIDWGRQGYQIHNLVRGCNPAPGAWTTLAGKKLNIFETKKIPAADPKGIGGAMGQVMEVDDKGFTVACADGRIRVLRVRAEGGQKVTGGDLVASGGIKAGDRLGV